MTKTPYFSSKNNIFARKIGSFINNRYYCSTCQNYNLCADCKEFSCEYEVTFMFNKDKRHEPEHELEKFDAPGEQKVVLKTDVVAKKASLSQVPTRDMHLIRRIGPM